MDTCIFVTEVMQKLKERFYSAPIIIRRDDYSRNVCANSKETLYRRRQLRNKRSTAMFSRKRSRLIRACHNRQDRRPRSARTWLSSSSLSVGSVVVASRDYRACQIVLGPRERWSSLIDNQECTKLYKTARSEYPSIGTLRRSQTCQPETR